MPTNIGKMRHRVDILARSVSIASGVSTERWTKTAAVWSSVGPAIGREYFIAAAGQAEDTVRFRMRYQGVLPEETRLPYPLPVPALPTGARSGQRARQTTNP